jgi:hypothetical protein
VGAEKLPGNVVAGGEWPVRPCLRAWEAFGSFGTYSFVDPLMLLFLFYFCFC